MNSMVIQPKKFREIPKNTEQEIAELERKLAEKKRELEEKREVKHEKEILKEVLKEKIEKPVPPKATPITPSAVQKVVIKKAKQIKNQQKERQIKLLTDLAFEKGVIHATEVAKKLEDPYILDEFHDTLVDELYSYLVEQGKLKRI